MESQQVMHGCDSGNSFPGCLIRWFTHIKSEHPFLIVVLCVLLALISGLFLGGYVNSGGSLKVVDASDIYFNVLSVTLSIIAIFVSILGFATYKTLEMKFEHLFQEKTNEVILKYERVCEEKQKEYEERNRYWLAKLNSDLSVGHYNLYEVDSSKNIINLNLAIKKIDKAYNYMEMLDENSDENKKLKGEVLNNYAYYLAVRGGDGDLKKVRKFVYFLESILPLFPEIDDSLWLDTISFARGKLKDSIPESDEE